MNRGLLVVLSVCLLFGAVGAAAGVSDTGFPQQDIDPDDVLMSVTIEDDGDAVWSIEYRTRLDSDEAETAFEDLRDDIESDPEPYAERFEDRMRATADTASDSTGREMAISEMTVSAEKEELPQEYGVLTYQFRWSNFAVVDGDRLVVGDAIDGLFLDEETALLVSWSDEYELASTSPTPTETRSGTVFYDGPISFASGEPRIELTADGAAPPAESDRALPVSPLIAAVLVILFVGALAGAFLLYRRRSDAPPTEHASPASEERSESAGATTGAEAADPTDAELLSNEEQVLQLIESEGGRMKQKAVAERLEWTDAKTSQVTKKLRENDELEAFRLGRENVLTLPETDLGEE